MAIVRCESHPTKGRKRTYVVSVLPVGYPETAMVCGTVSCEAPGLIWLENSEKEDYNRGVRIFRSFTPTMKMRAK